VADFRSIGHLADRVGAYCWVEHHLFAALGQWSANADLPPALAVHWAVAARAHGALAEAWRDRLPVRAGVDRAALVARPPGPWAEALDGLATADALARLDALNEVVLPRLHHEYEAHAATASPVTEGAVLVVLERCRREGSRELEAGRTLWRSLSDQPSGSGDVSREIERKLGGGSGVLPGEWAS
jgi:hypothetical protein